MANITSKLLRDRTKNVIIDDFNRTLGHLNVLSNWHATKRLDYTVTEPLREVMELISEAFPVAYNQVLKRNEASIRQSFSKKRRDAIDEAEYTKVGTKSGKSKNAKKRRIS